MIFVIMLVLICGFIVIYPIIFLLAAIIQCIDASIADHSWVPILVILGIILFFIVIPALINAGI